ncbi:hypothetical protein OIU85_006788 [Salix viminalis]|uniref:Amino acid transporter transmembrane domain-containing protein n=1 Tax=Salix viminalis TaxID=40686 RepID=A0A9Q0PLU1_SALVM|nr:hypothetical protein OIU85_006788 [Salix viminalis]
MATVAPNSMNISKIDKEKGVTDSSKELDAGALFVLQSRGSWIHCGFHLTTSIVGPVIFILPFALASLGWVPGVLMITIAALVTFYAYNLLSVVLEHHEQLGKRQIRFRDMARDILGPGWGNFFVGPIQFSICYGAVIACTLLGGQSLKFIYLLHSSNGTMHLYQFIIIFGAATLFLAQMPSFHSLRHINLFSLILCLAYSACVAAGSIHIGKSKNAPSKDYSINGSQQNQFFSAINAISIISTTYASGIIPEIQATIAPPVKGKMFKGLCICYAVIASTYFSVGVSGYWSFGKSSSANNSIQFYGRWSATAADLVSFADEPLHSHASDCYLSDLPATHKRSFRKVVCGPKDGSILHPKCYTEVDFSITVCYNRYLSGCHATFLRRHHGVVRSIWMHSSGFHSANGPLQCHIQAIEEGPDVLGEHLDSCSINIVGGSRSSSFCQTDSSRRQDL